MRFCIHQIIFTLLHIHSISFCVPKKKIQQETFSFWLLKTHCEGRTVASALRPNKTPQKTNSALRSPTRTGSQMRKAPNCCVNRIRQRANCLDFMLVYRTDNVVMVSRAFVPAVCFPSDVYGIRKRVAICQTPRSVIHQH